MKHKKSSITRILALLLVVSLIVGAFAGFVMPDAYAEGDITVETYQVAEDDGAVLEPSQPTEDETEDSAPLVPEAEDAPSVEPPDDEYVVIEIEDDDGNGYQFLVPSDVLPAAGAGEVQFINRGQWIPVPSAWHFAGNPLSVGFYQIRINGVYYPAYCLQPRVPAPLTGVYAYTVLNENILLARGLFYVFGAPGQRYYLDTLTNLPLAATSHTGSRLGDTKYLLSHLTLSIIYQGQWPPLLTGINQQGRNAAFAFRDWLQTAPQPPHARKSFSDVNVQATINVGGARQETPEITFEADFRNSITIDPSAFGDGVILLRTRDGGEPTFHWSATEIRGGDTFHFRVPLSAAVPGSHMSGPLQGTNTMHWRSILFNQGAVATQTMGGWSALADPVAPIQLSVTWQALPGELAIIKTSESGNVSGIQFRISGNGVDETVTTDETGGILVSGLTPGNTYTVEEINLPSQYRQPAAQTVTIVEGETAEVRFHNELIRGRIQGRKAGAGGDGLAGAVIGLFGESETVFTEARAIATTVSAENGDFAFDNLTLGRRQIRELRSPTGYRLSDEVFAVNITYDGQVVELTIVNERTRVSIRTQAHTGDGANQYFTHGDVLRMFDDVEITHEGILDGTERAFETFLVARLPNGTVQEIWRSGLIDYVVEDAVFTHRVVTEYVDTGRFPWGTIFTFREVGFNEYGEEDAWHNCDFEDRNQDLRPRRRVPEMGDGVGSPWVMSVVAALGLVAVGGVFWYERKKRKQTG
ncbi:MAG: SpaA isopeptide-forming pilin-related protein [Oscillospiraceae bacterium]|nr:SpaA isopeptide-forming pilin-related protein [Oscillospiraceae bacterium]